MESATAKMHPDAASLTRYARWLTIISWLTYPGVYLIKMVGLAGVTQERAINLRSDTQHCVLSS